MAEPNLFPFMRFADADAGLEFLQQAFGFAEREIHRGEDGRVVHAELTLGPGIVMVGEGDSTSQGIYAAIDDVDAHCARARAAGAEIVREPEDTPYGSREYSARDLGGHVWSFGTYKPVVDG